MMLSLIKFVFSKNRTNITNVNKKNSRGQSLLENKYEIGDELLWNFTNVFIMNKS